MHEEEVRQQEADHANKLHNALHFGTRGNGTTEDRSEERRRHHEHARLHDGQHAKRGNSIVVGRQQIKDAAQEREERLEAIRPMHAVNGEPVTKSKISRYSQAVEGILGHRTIHQLRSRSEHDRRNWRQSDREHADEHIQMAVENGARFPCRRQDVNRH